MNPVKSSWRWVRTNVRKLAQFCIFVLAVGLLLLEAADAVTLTWQMISLVTILTIVAVLNDLEKIDFGDFGGVRFREEIATVEQTVDRLETPHGRSRESEPKPAIENAESDGRTNAEDRSTGAGRVVTADVAADTDDGSVDAGAEAREISERVYELLETEPRAALSQLRLEIERAQQRAVGAPADRRAGQPIDDAVAAAALDVRSLCREAVHDVDDLERDDAARIVDLGLTVLERLLAADGTDEPR